MESQSADAEPPPPPKPDLRYPGLPRAETEGETHRDCLYAGGRGVVTCDLRSFAVLNSSLLQELV